MGTTIFEFIRENWFVIVIAIAIAIYTIEELLMLSKEEKIAAAKYIIAVSIDAIVAEAEQKFADYEKSGQLKRSYVIQMIYAKHPELSKAVEQEELIEWIDKLIEDSVARLRFKIIETDRK